MPAPPSTFMLRLRNGIWRVTFNGQFFGDYRSEGNALEGIAEAQRRLTTPAKVIRAQPDRL